MIALTPEQEAFCAALEQHEPEIQRTILRNWGRLFLSRDAEDMGCLLGDVENHPVLGNARDIRTSKLKYISEGLGIAVTKNTIYILKDKAA